MRFRFLMVLLWLAGLVSQGGLRADVQPVLTDLSLLSAGGDGWVAAVGTTLYTSNDLETWKELGTAPSRIRTVRTQGARVAAGGRDFVVTLETGAAEGGAKVQTLRGEIVDLVRVKTGWAALDASGKLWIEDAGGAWTPVKIADAKLVRIVETRQGLWVAAGGTAQAGKLFEAPAPEGPWTPVLIPPTAGFKALETWDRYTIAITTNGRIFRRSASGTWDETAPSPVFGSEAPLRLVASQGTGFYAALGDGVVHSWEGDQWFRCTYHDFRDTRRTLLLNGEQALQAALGEDPTYATVSVQPVELLVDSERPERPAMDLSLGNSLAFALADWDARVAEAVDMETALPTTERLFAAIAEIRPRIPAEEVRRWVTRVSLRLRRKLAAPEAAREFRTAVGKHFEGVVEFPLQKSAPAPQRLETPAEVLAPPIAPPALLREKAGAGRLGAMMDLAISYLQGAGVPEDADAAAFWLEWAHASDSSMPSYEQLEKNDLTRSSLEKLAVAGSVWAQILVADQLREGTDGEVDYAKAAEGYRRAARGGSGDALAALGEFYLSGWGVERNAEAAVALSLEPAKQRNPVGLYTMGRCYEMGAGLAQDAAHAADCFRAAAEGGERRAVRKYADLLLAGRGLPADPALARQWLERSSESGDREAARRLELLSRGAYTPAPPETEASHARHPPLFNWAAREAEARKGNAGACWDLAQAAAGGFGMYPNNRYASFWLGRAIAAGLDPALAKSPEPLAEASLKALADAGSLQALYRSAEAGMRAEATPEEKAQARTALQTAAERGHFTAQGRLGEELAAAGRPVLLSDALKWLQTAADNGDPFAQYRLGARYAGGEGVALDVSKAVSLYRKAALSGLRQAQIDLAFLIASGQARGTQLNEASAWFLALAGLPPKPLAPDSATRLIEAAARGGNGNARALLAVVLKLGFGTAPRPAEAAAWSILAEDTQSNLYALSWYAEGTDPAAVQALVHQLRTEQP